MDREYKLIIFDLGNTIIRFDHNISAAKLAKRFSLDQKKIYDLFFDSELTRAFDAGEISPKKFYQGATGVLGIDLPYSDFVSIWSDVFWEDVESCNLVRRLAPKYKLCLMSNVNELHFKHIKKRFNIINAFDYTVLSYLVKAMKPDKRIYEYASEISGTDFSGMLYIDDRKDLVKEASRYGIESVRFEGAKALEDWFLKNKIL